MAHDSDKKLPEKVSDAFKDIEEYTGINVPKATAKTEVSAYTQAAIATAFTVPVMFSGPLALSQQEPLRKPDEHLASGLQQSEVTLEDVDELESVVVSAMPFQVNTWDVVRAEDKGMIHYQLSPLSLPLVADSDKNSESDEKA